MSGIGQDWFARNNALWCDAVLTAAGAETSFEPDFWQASGKVLPLYPNVVTLSARPDSSLFEVFRELPVNAAVKDSFNKLDLTTYGFKKLFTGTWLYRPAQFDHKPAVSTDWSEITHSRGLTEWASAWNDNPDLQQLFRPSLLKSGTIHFAALRKEGSIKAGAVFNAGPKVQGRDLLGLSNVFCRRSWLYTSLSALIAPQANKPICTYETNDAVLHVYHKLGFKECGQLSVWQKQSPVQPATLGSDSRIQPIQT